jgi:hypothetical protein
MWTAAALIAPMAREYAPTSITMRHERTLLSADPDHRRNPDESARSSALCG